MRLKDRVKRAKSAFRRSWGQDISTPAARRRAWWDYQLFDHAFLRVWWTNFYLVAPGVFRSNQPSPARVAAYAAQGIKTILNMRDTSRQSHYLFEVEAATAAGITLVDLRLSASSLVPREELLKLHAAFLTAEKPFVMHCKSGADRAGLASALYLILICDVPVAQAKQQLHWRYAHLKHGKYGILDYFLERYAAAQAATGIAMLDWIETVYDPVALTAAYHAKGR